MAEAVTGKPTPAFIVRRKRREEETRGLFAKLALKIFRPVVRHRQSVLPLQAKAYALATAYLATTLDSMNPFWDNASDYTFDDFQPSAQNDLSSLHL